MYEQLRRTGVGATVNMDRCLDELQRRIQSMIELRTGWAEKHKMSRELTRLFKKHDVDDSGTMSPAEFASVLNKLNIGGTDAEYEALFKRFDLNENGLLSFEEFSDGVMGVKPVPLSEPQCRSALERVRARILKRVGSQGMRGFSRSLHIMDKDRSGGLSPEELMNGIRRYGIEVDDAEMKTISKFFDRDGNGVICITEFLRALRGPLNDRRKKLIVAAYELLDKNGDGTVTLADLEKIYDASQHPNVLAGTKTAEDVLREFAAGWDKDSDGTITMTEWEDYYKDISASIDDDDYFELMMRNVWHISGGEGWCENTVNRRVLVVHKDGRQAVYEIEKDLGIGPTDISKMKSALLKQGVTDIKRIDLAH